MIVYIFLENNHIKQHNNLSGVTFNLFIKITLFIMIAACVFF